MISTIAFSFLLIEFLWWMFTIFWCVVSCVLCGGQWGSEKKSDLWVINNSSPPAKNLFWNNDIMCRMSTWIRELLLFLLHGSSQSFQYWKIVLPMVISLLCSWSAQCPYRACLHVVSFSLLPLLPPSLLLSPPLPPSNLSVHFTPFIILSYSSVPSMNPYSLPSLQLWHLQSKSNSIRNLPMRILMVLLVILCCILIAVSTSFNFLWSISKRVHCTSLFQSSARFKSPKDAMNSWPICPFYSWISFSSRESLIRFDLLNDQSNDGPTIDTLEWLPLHELSIHPFTFPFTINVTDSLSISCDK